MQIDDWKKEIRTIDVDILNKISSIDTKEAVHLAMESHMNKKVEKEAEKIDKERASKMAAKREEFRKDKVKCKERYRSVLNSNNSRSYPTENSTEGRARKRNKSSKDRKQRSRTLPPALGPRSPTVGPRSLGVGPILSYEEVLNPKSPNHVDRGIGFEEMSDARKVCMRVCVSSFHLFLSFWPIFFLSTFTTILSIFTTQHTYDIEICGPSGLQHETGST